MQVVVRGKNMEVTPALRDYAEKKVGKIERFFDLPLTAQVTMQVQRDRHIVEVQVPLNGMLLRGEEASGDMYSSVDLVIEKLEKQIGKFKTRLGRRLRQFEPAVGAVVGEDAGEGEYRVVKTKRFPVKPMDVDEAVLQMNLLGHDFFVFANSETERINVLYRRRDGNYGLIDPEF
ncbi:MAG: ribosome-associated translation inhibitor RaiA [Firmicutes bacterium]|nr:ribosome-associated translation inhibitor RaiA [Bacillota bacterium]MCL5040679.1 ribosome-associated translation inhibitor RaiA [Bacillota bacterium]